MAQGEYEFFRGLSDDDILSPSEVAAEFRVNPKTVTRWARAGKLPYFRTIGGHRRFKVGDIRQAVRQSLLL